MSEKTSNRIAKIAARGIKNPGSLTKAEIAAVCGSALTQLEITVSTTKKDQQS